MLFIQGSPESLALLERIPEQGLAIVGTRKPQIRSRLLVKKTVSELRGTPLVIISGFARGIDTEAHLAAIEYGLPTIAVLGTPLDCNYPVENQALRAQILRSGGLIISEFSPGVPFYSSYFLRRNRLIAGWAKATWIVEASHRSGALNTASWARNQHRMSFATPCFPGDPAFAGTQKLLLQDDALPLWETESLGMAWSHLATPYPVRMGLVRHRKRSCQSESNQLSLGSSDADSLHQMVRIKTSEQGGLSIQEVLDATHARGWSPGRFFSAFQTAIDQGKIENENGLLRPGL